MTVRIRLQRHGAKKRPFYRVVAADQKAPRDGRFIELLGTYDPLQDPPAIRLHKDRVEYWVGVGASPSETAQWLIKKLHAGEVIDLSNAAEEKAHSSAKKEARQARILAQRQELAKANAKAAADAKAAAEASKAEAAQAKADAEAAAAAEAAPAAEAPADDAAGTEEA